MQASALSECNKKWLILHFSVWPLFPSDTTWVFCSELTPELSVRGACRTLGFSVVHIATLFQMSPTNDFQRLQNHMIMFLISNKPTTLEPISNCFYYVTFYSYAKYKELIKGQNCSFWHVVSEVSIHSFPVLLLWSWNPWLWQYVLTKGRKREKEADRQTYIQRDTKQETDRDTETETKRQRKIGKVQLISNLEHNLLKFLSHPTMAAPSTFNTQSCKTSHLKWVLASSIV